MPERLRNKVVAVVGGGSGIGRAAAILMAAEGARVVVADINAEKGTEVCQSIRDEGNEATFLPIDVRSAHSVQTAVEEIVALHGRIDSLYHSAADIRFINEQDRRLTELEEEIWDRMMAVVLRGTFLCCKFFGRQMIAQKSGSIILTATVDALVGCAGLDAYTAAKGGVVAMTRSFAAGIAADGVRVNAICPGFVATEPQHDWLGNPGAGAMMEKLHLLPVATPEQIAPFVVYLASDESAAATGGIYPIDSGYLAFKANIDVTGMMNGN